MFKSKVQISSVKNVKNNDTTNVLPRLLGGWYERYLLET